MSVPAHSGSPAAASRPALRAADLFAALADETRLRALVLLQRHGEMCVCEIQQVLGISQSRASRHLKTLREAGFVEDRRVGTWAHYRIPARPARGQRRLLALPAELLGPPALAEIDARLSAFRAGGDGSACPDPGGSGR